MEDAALERRMAADGWTWDGGPAVIQSRAVDSTGYVQPTVADIMKSRVVTGFVQHHNGIFPWLVSPNGDESDPARRLMR